MQRVSIAMGSQNLAPLPAAAPSSLVDVPPQVVDVNPLLATLVAKEVNQLDGNESRV